MRGHALLARYKRSPRPHLAGIRRRYREAKQLPACKGVSRYPAALPAAVVVEFAKQIGLDWLQWIRGFVLSRQRHDQSRIFPGAACRRVWLALRRAEHPWPPRTFRLAPRLQWCPFLRFSIRPGNTSTCQLILS